jgi:mannosyltransferase OCH1-like enzyme
MSAITVAHRRRRRRKAIVLLAAVVAVALLLLRNYISITYNILFRGPFIAHEFSVPLHISREKDDFDITFQSYPTAPITRPNASHPVPAIMHHILLGSPKTTSNLTSARDACMKMHPGYEFKYWTDDNSKDFVFKHYPHLFTMWSSYRWTIQKADSLRYMVLHAYGGEFASHIWMLGIQYRRYEFADKGPWPCRNFPRSRPRMPTSTRATETI